MSENEAINLLKNADLTKNRNIIKHKKLLWHTEMGKEITTFGDIEIDEQTWPLSPTFLKDVDIDNVCVCVSVCLFLFTLEASPHWKNNQCNARVQISDVVPNSFVTTS